MATREKGRFMKLSERQLRQIINEEIKRLHEAPGETIDIAGEVGSFIEEALLRELVNDDDLVKRISDNAWEMMMGTLGEDQVPVPGRYEDVLDLADAAAGNVLKSSVLRDELFKIAKNMLESLLDNVGTPRRGT